MYVLYVHYTYIVTTNMIDLGLFFLEKSLIQNFGHIKLHKKKDLEI